MLVVEPAREDDAALVDRLASAVLGAHLPWSREYCMVARDVERGELVGFALAERHEPCEGHLLALAIDGDHRGEGLGGTLLRSMQQVLASSGALRMCLEARADDPRARAFYQRHGFTADGIATGAFPDGTDAVHFTRPI